MPRQTLIAAAALSFTLALAAPLMPAEANSESLMAMMPTITDSKLGTMRYGTESLLHWVGKMQPGDLRRAEGLLRDIEKLRSRLSRVRGADPEQAAALDAYLISLGQAVIYVANTTVPEPQPQPQQAGQAQAGAEGTRAEPAPQTAPKADPLGITRGEATAFANEMQRKYGIDGPLELRDPRRMLDGRHLSMEAAEATIAMVEAFRAAAAVDAPKLAHIHKHTGMGDYWLRWITKEGMERFDQNFSGFVQMMQSNITHAISDAVRRVERDPVKYSRQFRGDQAEAAMARDAAMLATIDAGAKLEAAFDLGPVFTGRRSELAGLAGRYAEMVAMVESGALTEMPEDIGDAELRAIAETVLAKPRYEIAGWERLIVNAPLMPRDRAETRVFNGALVTEIRVWEQFQVTTVERAEDGKLYLHYNVIARFSRAPTPTPVGEWIVHKRFRGAPVAEDRV